MASRRRGGTATPSPPPWDTEGLNPANLLAAALSAVATGAAVGWRIAVIAVLVAAVIYRLIVYVRVRARTRTLARDFPTLAILTLLLGFLIYPSFAEPTAGPSSAQLAKRQILTLAPDVQIDAFKAVLGTPPVQTQRGSYIESVWKKRLFFVQAVSTAAGKIVLYSVTTRSPALRLGFVACATDIRAGHVTLGGSFPAIAKGEGPFATFEVSNTHDVAYSEIYGGIGVCNYEYQVLT